MEQNGVFPHDAHWPGSLGDSAVGLWTLDVFFQKPGSSVRLVCGYWRSVIDEDRLIMCWGIYIPGIRPMLARIVTFPEYRQPTPCIQAVLQVINLVNGHSHPVQNVGGGNKEYVIFLPSNHIFFSIY